MGRGGIGSFTPTQGGGGRFAMLKGGGHNNVFG